MLKLSKLTDYGTQLMTELAARPAEVRTAQDLAERTHLGLATVSKLLKLLTQAELLASTRGMHGGYRLARTPDSITVADVVAALEGPVAVTECAGHDSVCLIESHCTTRTNWRLINTAIHTALASVTLAQMAAPLRARSTAPRPTEFPLVRNA